MKVTAKDIYFKIKEYRTDLISGLDNWIADYLFDKFKDQGYSVAVIDSVITNQGWSKTVFTEAMKDRGFSVEYACQDSPCGSCYFTINIPPQER